MPLANRSSARARSVLRLGELRIEPGDLRVERLHLQGELLVADRGNDLALLDPVALAHRERRDGAADAGARRLDAALSTVANTAFSSASDIGVTVKSCSGMSLTGKPPGPRARLLQRVSALPRFPRITEYDPPFRRRCRPVH